MNNCALICEYNPFHTGHAYQLDKIRERGASNIVCIMSGNFTQNALPAFCAKELRAECAVLCGGDAVVELPAIYATASAGFFAEGGIKIASDIKGIKTLAMGVTAEPSEILRLADIKITRANEFSALLSARMSDGKSYNAASLLALCAIYNKLYPQTSCDVSSIISDPNNMLAIEYIVAISKFAPHIEPMPITRVGACHGDKTLGGDYVSATAIREAFGHGNESGALAYVPFLREKILRSAHEHAPDISAFKKLAAYSLRAMPLGRVSMLRDCSEGMEYLLAKIRSNDYDAMIAASECRRYGKKRLARLFLDAALGITKDLTDNKFCTRLLARKADFDVSILPEYVKLRNSDIKRAAENAEIRAVLSVDERAATLYNTLSGLDGGYYNFKAVTV